MDEIFEITEFVQEEAGFGTDLIWGNCYDESLGDAISVTLIATGFDKNGSKNKMSAPNQKKVVVSLDEDEQPKKDAELRKEEVQPKAPTVEFDNLKENISEINRRRFSGNEPFIKTQQREQEILEQQARINSEAQRRERLRNTQVKLTNPGSVGDLENQPAYLRRGVSLDQTPNSAEDPQSRWSVTDGEKPEIKEDNKFLHDNVD